MQREDVMMGLKGVVARPVREKGGGSWLASVGDVVYLGTVHTEALEEKKGKEGGGGGVSSAKLNLLTRAAAKAEERTGQIHSRHPHFWPAQSKLPILAPHFTLGHVILPESWPVEILAVIQSI